METIFRVKDIDFSIDKETGDLHINTGDMYSDVIPFEEAIDFLKSLREEQLKVIERKEFENGNWFDKIFSKYESKSK